MAKSGFISSKLNNFLDWTKNNVLFLEIESFHMNQKLQ